MTAATPLNANPVPNAQLMRAILAAGPSNRCLLFLREIAFRAPEWVRSDVIEQRLQLSSSELGNADGQLRKLINNNWHAHLPSPWGHVPRPGSGIFAWYLMTTEVALIILSTRRHRAHPRPRDLVVRRSQHQPG